MYRSCRIVSTPMAAPKPQFLSGSVNPNVKATHAASQKKSSLSEERERLAKVCKAHEEEYLKEESKRFKKYAADFRQELLETYFSNKDYFGDDIYEETGIDGIKAGRFAGLDSFADPVAYLKKKEAASESAANSSTGKGKQVMMSD